MTHSSNDEKLLILLVRSMDDVGSAIAAASALLAQQQLREPWNAATDRILGVWVRCGLDADLPATLGVRESLSVSFVWSLCRLDGSRRGDARGSVEDRSRALRDLMQDVMDWAAPEAGVFFPVFDVAEARDAMSRTLEGLRAGYPGQVGASWFVHDPARGLTGPMSG